MSLFTDARASMLEQVFYVMADLVEFNVGNNWVQVSGILRHPEEPSDLDQTYIIDLAPYVRCMIADTEQYNITRGTKVRLNGLYYIIKSSRPQDDGTIYYDLQQDK